MHTHKDNPPKVTVIVPNYNHARFLRKRMQSILNQTYQDFEVIYLDDASTDGSNETFAEFAKDNRIARVVHNEVNSGSPFKQWNKGVQLARGEYIWIAETDDYADERLLESLVKQLDSHPKAGLAYCQSWCVDQDDHVSSTMNWWTDDLDAGRWKTDFVANGKEECRRYLASKNTIPNASAVLIRKSIYEKVRYADEGMKLCGDWMLWVKILLDSDIAFVADPLNYFRTHNQSVRNKTDLNGVLAEEAYLVLSHILTSIQLTPEQTRIACDAARNRWMHVALAKQSQIPWLRNRKIYGLASKADASTKKWLVKLAITKLLRKFRLLRFVTTGAKFARRAQRTLSTQKGFHHTNH